MTNSSGLTIVAHVAPSPAQWDMVIRGMRNSWESWSKGDSRLTTLNDYLYTLRVHRFDLGPNDRDLALRLAKLGADHGKYLRQLPVIVEIKAPGYWWREFDTYRIGVEASDITQNSTSMMHMLGRDPVDASMFHFDDPDSEAAKAVVAGVSAAREAWIEAGKRKGPEATEWRLLQQSVPYAWLYLRTVSLNYQVLRSIYHSRRNHRLTEWRTFCDWIATLPHSELVTGE